VDYVIGLKGNPPALKLQAACKGTQSTDQREKYICQWCYFEVRATIQAQKLRSRSCTMGLAGPRFCHTKTGTNVGCAAWSRMLLGAVEGETVLVQIASRQSCRNEKWTFSTIQGISHQKQTPMPCRMEYGLWGVRRIW
jgi:hypothetical protein